MLPPLPIPQDICAMSFPKRFIGKGFPFLLVLTCYKHPFLRKWQWHSVQPQVHHYHPALHGSASLRDLERIFSLTNYSFGDLKGIFYDSSYKTHRCMGFHHYLTHKWHNYFRYWWEKAQSQVANPGISQVEINHPFPTSALGREQLWNATFSIYQLGRH